jgi:predicted DNA-binding protein
MTTDKDWTPPRTAEELAAWTNHLQFHPEETVAAAADLPPVLGEGEEVLVPRSFKIPLELDQDLQQMAAARGVTKSQLIRDICIAAVAAERANRGEDVLVPMSEVYRALGQVRGLPRSA